MDKNAFVIRPLCLSDFDWLYERSRTLDAGLTSLPSNKDFLMHRVEAVDQSFKEILPVEQRIFIFVREELASKEKIGLAGLEVTAGYRVPFYSYQISTVSQVSDELDIYLEHKILNLVNNFQSATELISFWIHPDYRGKNLSKTLSLSRFLYAAQFPQWFSTEFIAEIRGVCDADGNSPFWDAIGKHFFAMDFKKADYLTMSMGKQYISDLMPREHIYLELLSAAAQEVVGVPHPTAVPAKHLLEGQGFKYNNYIDIFDAGPLINTERNHIKTIANSKLATIVKINNKIDSGIYVLICNIRTEMRITASMVLIENSTEIIIDNTVAEILDVVVGDQIRFCAI